MSDAALQARRNVLRRGLKPAVFMLCLVPLVLLVARGFANDLSANPVEFIIRTLGDWALRFLLLALAVTPLRLATGWNEVARLRRMLGLFAFTYVVLHLLAYTGLDQGFDFVGLWNDVMKRIYITVGMAAFALLLPLAVTSADAMIRKLGGARWRMLHRLAYPAGVLAVIHYFLMIKAGYQQPTVYAVILAVLLGVRLVKRA
ncbi:MAG: sulfoxide reductase heme-binding subunit YedZ [Rhodospirillaceae bacterium]|nr:sulfoxide reductase heme-binding subunit YedZ [Rhodospirillaceae bacterium]